MAQPSSSLPSIAALTLRYGANAMVLATTISIVGLSVLITSLALIIFQGHIDALGIAICIAAPLLIFPWPGKVFFTTLQELQRTKADLARRNSDLERAISEVKTLSGLLPLCCSCKKVRDDRGYWKELESYFSDQLDLDITHGYCPECCARLYPELGYGSETEGKIMMTASPETGKKESVEKQVPRGHS